MLAINELLNYILTLHRSVLNMNIIVVLYFVTTARLTIKIKIIFVFFVLHMSCKDIDEIKTFIKSL